ncbi:MAG: helix-turn-helix transcriptional regulator [Dehalococcoidia bacterium]|nr:helix-turn-helix transcriptional regulator [Dehalococcoidia bacterium]MBL7126936.1 helix-turn-helix transcriptional regulator [Dehalococcoidales bacterium]
MVDDVMNRDVIVLQEMEARRVGDGIRELRQRCGLSIEDLARRANVSHDYLFRLEEGHELKIERSVLDYLRQASSFSG